MTKTVLALTLSGRSAASSRIRAHIPLDYIEDWGHLVHRVTADQKIWPLRVLRLALSAQFDTIFLQKVMPPRWLLAVLRARCNRLVFDLDDAIYLGYPGAPTQERRRLDRRVRRGVPFFTSILTSNKLIRSDLGLQESSTCVVFPGPAPQPQASTEDVVRRKDSVLWLGSPSTVPNIEALLSSLLERLPDENFLLVGTESASTESCVTRIPWSHDVEVDALRRSRVGLMPLEQTEWNDRKAGYKILEYLKGGVIPVTVDSAILETLLGADAGTLCEVISTSHPDDWAAGIRRALDRECDDAWFAARERVFSTWSTKNFAALILG